MMRTKTVMKQHIGGKKKRRLGWRAIMCTLLLLGIGSSSCSGKPRPNPDDDRPCWVGVLDSETAMLLRASRSWEVKAGDLIQTPRCANDESEALLNSILQSTR